MNRGGEQVGNRAGGAEVGNRGENRSGERRWGAEDGSREGPKMRTQVGNRFVWFDAAFA